MQSRTVSTEEMDVSDSMEGSLNMYVPLETVSAATEQGSTSCTDNLESAGSPDADIRGL